MSTLTGLIKLSSYGSKSETRKCLARNGYPKRCLKYYFFVYIKFTSFLLVMFLYVYLCKLGTSTPTTPLVCVSQEVYSFCIYFCHIQFAHGERFVSSNYLFSNHLSILLIIICDGLQIFHIINVSFYVSDSRKEYFALQVKLNYISNIFWGSNGRVQ